VAKNNLKFEIGNWKLAQRGFTIVELLVAMSLLVILLGLSSMVFKTTVAAHRAAGASIDVSRNLRAITDQLTADFRGLQKDAPLAIWFEQEFVDTDDDGVPDTARRYDQIQFFADGDFQTTKQYGTPPQTVYGNMARIYYGHAWSVDSAMDAIKGYRVLDLNGDGIEDPSANILARRTHILTNNAALLVFPSVNQATNQLTAFPPGGNNYYEFDNFVTLSLWNQLLTVQANCDEYLSTCFNNTVPPGDTTLVGRVGRPVIDMGDIDYLHNLLSQGVVQMRVQWAYTAEDLTADTTVYTPIPPASYFAGVRWWPSVDPLGDGNDPVAGTDVDSDFDTIANQFGAYFKMPDGSGIPDWLNVISAVSTERCRTDDGSGTNTDVYFRQNFYPKALKFSFVLRDSNGVFAEGKTFTHIVYLDN